jgi:hypothetical protein
VLDAEELGETGFHESSQRLARTIASTFLPADSLDGTPGRRLAIALAH